MAILNDKNDLAPRKLPQQKRSMQMRRDILLAAMRLLSRAGPLFSMSQVATAAGISVGSLYQYFASREALLFAVQLDEWERRIGELATLLAGVDAGRSPAACYKDMVEVFFQRELEELYLNGRIGQQGVALFKTQPEFETVRANTIALLESFFQQVRPELPAARAHFLAEFNLMTFVQLAEQCAFRPNAAELTQPFGLACAEMLCRFNGLPGTDALFSSDSADADPDADRPTPADLRPEHLHASVNHV